MTRIMRLYRLGSLLVLCLFITALTTRAAAAPPITRTLAPIGSGYSEITLQRFAQAAARHDTSGTVDILILPITFATDPFVISAKERKDNLSLAETRRGQVESACTIVK